MYNHCTRLHKEKGHATSLSFLLPINEVWADLTTKGSHNNTRSEFKRDKSFLISSKFIASDTRNCTTLMETSSLCLLARQSIKIDRTDNSSLHARR
jgi:hypothetical protein